MATRRPRVLMVTEGTYPYAVGGVSSWCDLIVRGIPEVEWLLLPLVGSNMPARPLFDLPANVELVRRLELWSHELPPRRFGRRSPDATELPAILVRDLLGWEADDERLLDALVRCRQKPTSIRPVFRSRAGWSSFLRALAHVLDERPADALPPPRFDVVDAARLYQTMYWVARTAATDTPRCDVLLVTAAGWAAIPALVHKRLFGTPLVVTEHGVYVREAYLDGVRRLPSASARFVATRLALGLARAAYASSDVICPVTDANARWEQGLGVEPRRIRVISNGVSVVGQPTPPPNRGTVVSVGRIDPLKDVHTMLRVAREVLERVPGARFLHYGPVTPGQEAYGRSCHELHARLGLGERFVFMGPTTDPHGVVRDADIVLMTSISEGLPLATLEAMAQGRPVVSTGVGGVPDMLRGAGLLAPACDVHRLAAAVCLLLRDPKLADSLGRRGYERVGRRFTEEGCVGGYRNLLFDLVGRAAA
jgi:glycosyltransferase involved in cell wall biosynthesis